MTNPSLAHDPTEPLAIMFSGGGARGAFQVGVWDILSNDPRALRGRVPDIISGTSAGAINAALIAAGLNSTQMLEFWLDLAERPPVRANPRFFDDLNTTLRKLAQKEITRNLKFRSREARVLYNLLGKHRWYRRSGLAALAMEFALTARFDNISTILKGIGSSHLFNTDQLRDRLREHIGSDHIPSDSVKLAINTVEIGSGSVLRIVNAKPDKTPQSSRHYLYAPKITLDMVVASASIPLLFNPVEIDGKMLWDGGLLVNSPMAPAVALGARRLIPVLVTTGGNDAVALDNFGVAVERVVDTFLENAYNVDRKLLLDRNAIAKQNPGSHLSQVDLFRAIRPVGHGRLFDAGSYLYFEKDHIQSMFIAGRSAALTWLGRGIKLDSSARET